MAITKRRLYSPDASVSVREGLTAADAGTWTPDDIAGAAARDAVILDAREWESVRVSVEFTDGAGASATGTAVTLQPLIAMPSELSDAVRGRRWVELAATAALAVTDQEEVVVNGHYVAFRATVVDLTGGATDAQVRVTGGRRREPDQD